MGLSKEEQKNKHRIAGNISFTPPTITKSPKQVKYKYKRISYKVKKKQPKDTQLLQEPKTQILCLGTILKSGTWRGLTIKEALSMGMHKRYFNKIIKQNKYAFDIELLEALK